MINRPVDVKISEQINEIAVEINVPLSCHVDAIKNVKYVKKIRRLFRTTIKQHFTGFRNATCFNPIDYWLWLEYIMVEGIIICLAVWT